MTDFTTILAQEQPLNGTINPLLPKNYDVVWSSVCLVVILILFWKFVLPKFQAVIEERRANIEGGLERAKNTQSEARILLERYNEQLAEARSDAQRIRDEAREQGQQIIEQMKEVAQKESDRIIDNGQQQLQAQKQQLITELRSEVGRVAIDLAEKIMNEQLSDDLRRSDSIDKFLTELDGVDVSAGK